MFLFVHLETVGNEQVGWHDYLILDRLILALQKRGRGLQEYALPALQIIDEYIYLVGNLRWCHSNQQQSFGIQHQVEAINH